ncbi:GGDEF domain-containing protein [Actinoplanes sp. NPDC048967]|uniref:GGDEF domain-containing protein n=1 Tax=Actinoplanes sp. NPDC048967 TaxID=3155269 RepID=UPI00340C1602
MHRRIPRPWRRADPLVVVLIVLAVTAVVGFGARRTGTGPQVAMFWLLMAAVHGCFAVLSAQVARAGPAVARRLWLSFSLAGAAFLVGDAAQLVAAVRAPLAPSSLVGTEFQFGSVAVGMVLLVTGLLRYPLGELTGSARARLHLDAATVLAAATTFGLWLFEVPAGPRDAGWVLGLLVALLVMPGIFLVAIFAVLRLVLSGRTPFTRMCGIVGGVAAVLQAVLQTVPGSVYLTPRYTPWLFAGNVVASTLLALVARTQQLGAGSTPRPGTREQRRPYSVLPYAGMAAVWALTLTVLVTRGLDARSWVVGIGASVTTVLVISRQLNALRHITELLRERDELTARLTELAYHDALTGLANRGLFMRLLDEGLAAGPVTVLLIDLDDFKPVNDAFGHATGDQLLIEVARRLRAGVRAGDTVARLGGDEFAVLMPGLAAARGAEVVRELTGSLTGAVRIRSADVPLRASVGLATGRPGEHDPDSLLHAADMAMYAVKEARRHLTASDLR